MLRTIAVVLTLTASLSAAEIRSKHIPYGLPTGTPESNDLVFTNCYVLSSNDTTKFADWVAYRLTLMETSGRVALDRDFRPDPLIADGETLETGDYKGAYAANKYEKGHLAPLAAFKGTPYAYEVNYLSNIAPQTKQLNGGPWKNLEAAVRKLTHEYRTVWVMTGPLYDVDAPALPNSDETHDVAGAFWKVVIAKPNGGPLKVAAFIMGQDIASTADYVDSLETIEEIQNRSGLTLFPDLPPARLTATDAAWVETWKDLE